MTDGGTEDRLEISGIQLEDKFEIIQMAGAIRCETTWHPVADWSLMDWGVALGGECGEALNEIKKLRLSRSVRNARRVFRYWPSPWVDTDEAPPDTTALRRECGDVLAYLALLATRAGFDLFEAWREKFNEVSARPEVNSPIRVEADGKICGLGSDLSAARAEVRRIEDECRTKGTP